MNVTKKDVLRSLNFGSQVAEEERDQLSQYFVTTQSWERLYAGNVDVVYGSKGAGKSALYVLIQDHTDDLFDAGILLIAAENPQSAPAFKGLLNDPPTSERELIGIWKLYFASLLGRMLLEYGINNDNAKALLQSLSDQGLLPQPQTTLSSILKSVRDYARRVFRPSGIEGGITVDPLSGLPSGFSGKILFEEPSMAEEQQGLISVNELFRQASAALSFSNYKAWITIDRLDVAFDDSQELEKNALRALFRAYRDLREYECISLKVFLRTDIWERITEEGFREATHITRDMHLSWSKLDLQNLIIRRLLNNKKILHYYGVDKNRVLGSAIEQNALFHKIFPSQVERGEKQSTTLDWLLKRTTDGTGKHNPREIILLLNRVCELQNQRIDRGEPEPSGSLLFDRTVFKDSMPALSEYKINKVIYAEYPNLRDKIEALEGQKTDYDPSSLAKLWGISEPDAIITARKLRDVGFFEERGTKDSPTFWVPFIFRPYLSLVQGKAE